MILGNIKILLELKWWHMILFLFGLWLKTSYSAIFIQNLRYKTNVLVGKAQSFPSRNLQSSKRTAGSSSQVPKKA